MTRNNVTGRGVPNDQPPNDTVLSGGQQIGALPGVKYGSKLPVFDDRDRDPLDLYYTPKRVRRFNLNLANARTREKFQIPGTFIWVPDGSTAVAIADIYINSLENDPIPFKPGMFISGIPFDQLWVSNSAQAGVSMTVVVIQDIPASRVLVE